MQGAGKGRRTRVFQLIGSTKPFTTSAMSSAPTRARPTLDGSRFMHVSQSPHWCAIAGIGFVAQRFVLYCSAHCAISCTMSAWNRMGQWISMFAGWNERKAHPWSTPRCDAQHRAAP